MSMRFTKLLTVAAALAITGVAGATTTRVVVRDAVPSTTVQFGDLALNTRAGVARLHARIRAAAEQVCEGIDSRVLGLRQQHDICVSTAIAESVAAVGNTNLSEYHRLGKKAVLLAAN